MVEREEFPEEEIIPVNNALEMDFSKPYMFVNNKWWFKILSIPFNLFIYIFLTLCSLLFLGLKAVNRKKARKIMKENGCIIVANHCHYFDTPFVGKLVYPRQIHVTSVQRNFEVPVVRHIIRLLQAIPIPRSVSGLKQITNTIGEMLKKKHHVLFMPEGNLKHLSEKVYRFKLGAFQQAYYHQVPIIPITFVLKRRKFFGKQMPKNWVKILAVFGDPIMPPTKTDNNKIPKEELKSISEDIADWMEETILSYKS